MIFLSYVDVGIKMLLSFYPSRLANCRKSALRLERPTMAASSAESSRQAAPSEDCRSGQVTCAVPFRDVLGSSEMPHVAK